MHTFPIARKGDSWWRNTHFWHQGEIIYKKINTFKKERGPNQGYTPPSKAKILMKDKQFYGRKNIVINYFTQQRKKWILRMKGKGWNIILAPQAWRQE